MYYKFDYGSSLKRFVSIFFETIGALCEVIALELALMVIFAFMAEFFFSETDGTLFVIFFALFAIAGIMIFLGFLINSLSKRGVFIDNDRITIKTRCLNIHFLGVNYTIQINDIIDIEKIYYKKPLMYDGKNYTTFLFNAENVVKITTEKYTFYPSIVNADSFVREIKKRQERGND